MSWNNNAILEFIELYKSERTLWDPRHPLHRNRSEISESWARIQSSLCIDCSIVDLKKKKESLMTSYRMHFNKKKKSPEYRTTWFPYPLMDSFLGEVYGTDTQTMEEEFFNSTEYSEPESVVSDHQYAGTGRRSINVIEKPPTKSRSSSQNVDKDLFYAKKPTNEYTKNIIEESKYSVEESKGEDECDLYGQLLVKKLRKLDEHQRDVAMHEIDNIMFRAKMQCSKQSQQRSYPNSPSPMQRKTKSPLFIVTSQQHSQYENDNVYQQDPMQTHPS